MWQRTESLVAFGDESNFPCCIRILDEIDVNSRLTIRTTFTSEVWKVKQYPHAGRVVLASAKRLRSKLNHAVEATYVKLAASKTALGLHSVLFFQTSFKLTIETYLKISTGVSPSRLGCGCNFLLFVKNF
jgi:hypothetical protein